MTALPRPSPRSAGANWLLGLGAAVAGLLLGSERLIRLSAASDRQTIADLSLYNMSVLSANYFGLGFVRRGLGGTISAMLSNDLVARAVEFQLLSLVMLLVPVTLIIARLARSAGTMTALFFATFLVLFPRTFLTWSFDIARTDMLTLAFVMWAFIMAVDNRWRTAAVVLAASQLVHETGVIFGTPLLMALAWRRWREGRADVRRLGASLALYVALSAAIVGLPALIGPSASRIIRYGLDHAPAPHDIDLAAVRDCAIYMLATGLRGLKTAICYNRMLPLYPIMIAMNLFVFAATAFGLRLFRRGSLASVVLCLAPLLFMHVVGNDSGRWMAFAMVDLWLLATVAPLEGEAMDPRNVVVGLAVLGTILALGRGPVYMSNSSATKIALRLGYPGFTRPADWISACDPHWQDVLHGGQPGLAAE